LQQAANLAPNEFWIQANLAWALGKSGSWQQAETTVARALQLDSDSAFALGLQAWIAVNRQQWKPAIYAARQAIAKSKQTNPNNCQQLQRWVYPCLTVALDRAVVTKQARDVERCIQEFTAQVPDSVFVWGFKGWRQGSQGLWADAIPSFEQAKRQAQAPAWVFLNLGIAHEHLRNIQGAIQVYEAYSRTFQNDAFALFRLGTLLGRQRLWLQARSCLERAVQLKPGYAEAYHNLGWVLLNSKSQDGHVENFTKMWSAYRKAAELYAQQQKYALAEGIKQAFQVVGVEL
jgi:tetratricopeptide (TPR) repeat protein